MSKLATELSAAQLVFFRLVVSRAPSQAGIHFRTMPDRQHGAYTQVEQIMTAPKMRYAVSIKDASKCAKDKSIVPAMSYVQAEALLKSLTFKGKHLVLAPFF